MKLAVYHLLNDNSGSPLVLHTVLAGLVKRGADIELTTSAGGPLDDLPIDRRRYRYRFSKSAAATMIRYAGVQLRTFFSALRHTFDRKRIFYINTLLPVGPALAARITGHRVIYHYHENADAKGLVYRTLAAAMQRLADRIICVSEYQASFLHCRDKVCVIPNAVPQELALRLKPDAEAAFRRRNVLMLASLKGYKGTSEFVELARRLPDIRFTLVLNEDADAVETYFAAIHKPDNLTVHSRTNDVARFYNDASLVLNLSNPREFIETFGLTALEAMTAGLPVIVPPVGGIAEMVTDGVEGYRIDSAETERIASAIENILSDRSLYMKLSRGALAAASRFSSDAQVEAIHSLLLSL